MERLVAQGQRDAMWALDPILRLMRGLTRGSAPTFLNGSPGQEVGNLILEATGGPQKPKSRLLPPRRTLYRTWRRMQGQVSC
jgi:hypothetical protein